MKISGLSRKRYIFTILFISTILMLTVGWASASSEEDGGGITVIPDASVLIQIANFLFLIWALNMILYRPIRKILRQRKQKVESFETTIETHNRDIQKKDEAFASGLKAARAKGLKEKEALMQAAAEEEKKIIENINTQAQTERTEVLNKIARDVEVAKALLQEKVDEFANDISQKILGRAVE